MADHSLAADQPADLGSPPLDLRQLHCFLTVVEEGQITAAAERLGVAQPALSRTIARVEAAAGAPLLERRPRGVTLTPAGARFHEHAVLALAAAREAVASVSAIGEDSRLLTIGYGSHLLPPTVRPALRELARRRPDAEMRLEQVPPRRREVEVLDGDIDAEIVLAPIAGEDLEALPLRSCRRVVVMPESHPLATREALTVADVEEETFLGVHPDISHAWVNMWLLLDLRRSPPKLTPETPYSLEEAWGLIISGRAVTVLPDFLSAEIAQDGIVAVPLAEVPPVEVLLVRRRTHANPLLDELFRIVRAEGPASEDGPIGTPHPR